MKLIVLILLALLFSGIAGLLYAMIRIGAEFDKAMEKLDER